MEKNFVLSLDGVPYSLLMKLFELNVMPNLRKLALESSLKEMESVLPPVSSSAWASFMTGVSPLKHGIMGFLERDPQTLDWAVPSHNDLLTETMWAKLSREGKRVFVMNVPLTFPPPKINGIAVCGFLGSDILKGTYPEDVGSFLKSRGYQIDADIELGKRDLKRFIFHLYDILEKRFEMMHYFWKKESWDFFMLHIMETDRMHHLVWEYMENAHAVFSPLFYDLYRKIDIHIGEILELLPDEINFVLLSDHGFTTLKKEVYLNRWLWENGFLKFRRPNPQNLHDIHPNSTAYALYPGRIYINLQGREKNGRIRPGIEYNAVLDELTRKLYELHDPDSWQKIVNQILTAEDLINLYDKEKGLLVSDDNRMNHIPDLLVTAHKGYDFKGQLWNYSIFDKTKFNGTHTFDDAFILSKNREIPDCLSSIADVRSCLFGF
jgi:predicted AlkP superfamily phosphohydrolase/phosphomutase